MKRAAPAVLIGCDAALEELLNMTGLAYSVSETAPSLSNALVLVPQILRRQLASELDDKFTVGVVKSFDFGKARPREEVARQPKSALRRKLWLILLEHYAQRGELAPVRPLFPKGMRTVFSFRVDADEYERVMFERFFETAKKYAKAVSIFFNMANYDAYPEAVKGCLASGFDVHSHAYTHFTYRSKAQNLFNLHKADAALERAGAPKNAFASPYGRWYPALQEAIDDREYSFSSEFSFNYDDFPSYPVIGGKRSSVLQVPVHPVGLGVYLESGAVYDEAEVRAYYGALFEKKYQAAEPVIFYDHPTQWLGVYPEFMDFLFGLARSKKDVWICSMSEWAEWWKKRASLEVEWIDPTAELRKLSGSWDEGRLYREARPDKIVKNALKSWLDWETSTPSQEILRDSLPSHIKVALRRLR